MLSPGAKLGRYEIRSKLGEGGMGEVYLALDTELNRTVAIKLLPQEFAANEQRLRRFTQEAQSASALNHPHILTIYEIGNADHTRFIATEFIDGMTLREYVRNRSLHLSEILEIGIQTASALVAAHAAGIVHRDIKPDNIMVRRDGYVKVLDFGLAKLNEPLGSATDTEAPTRAMVNTGEGMVMGTPDYMSPEQAKGLELDVRTDLWSFGVVLYELISGRGPFAGATVAESISLVLQKDPAPLTRHDGEVPAELERIVGKALRKDREERYQTAKDLLVDLRTLKRKLELDAEMDRSVAGDLHIARPTNSLAEKTVSEAREPTASSAEYIVSGIKRHKLGVALAALVLLAVAAGIFFYLRTRNSEVAIDSIAVLPFQNRSAEADSEYLSDGLAESLIYRLSQLPDLKVSPTSSVFVYKDKGIDPVRIGKELGVSAVLSGRIVQRGDNLTISAELVDVRYNKLLWGEQYERKMSEVLQTQREIAREIVEKLRLKVSREERGLAKHYTESNEAYQLYLRGRYHWNKRTPAALHKAIEYFERAIEQDPRFALAYAGLADTYNLLGAPEAGGDIPPKEALPKAKAAALKALEIDETVAEGHVSMAHVKTYYDRDWPGGEREYKRAIELNPNYSVAHHWYAIFLTIVGRPEEALREINRGLELDPLSLPMNVWYGRILYTMGRREESLAQLRKTVDLDPNFTLARYRLGQLYIDAGMTKEALAEFEQVLRQPGGKALALTGFAQTYAAAGNREEAQKNLKQLLEMSEQQYISPTQIGLTYALLGESDKAFEWIAEGKRTYDLTFVWLKYDPRFAPLRSDPRYAELERDLRLP